MGYYQSLKCSGIITNELLPLADYDKDPTGNTKQLLALTVSVANNTAKHITAAEGKTAHQNHEEMLRPPAVSPEPSTDKT